MASKVLEDLDDFFAAGEVTTEVSGFLNSAAEQYAVVQDDTGDAVPAPSDSEGGLLNYHLFQKYGALIDNLLTQFTKKSPYEPASVLEACKVEFEQHPQSSPYTAVEYLNAALEPDAFFQLVWTTRAMNHYEVGGEEEEEYEGEEGEENEGEHQEEEESASGL
jgi:hypothetical protein